MKKHINFLAITVFAFFFLISCGKNSSISVSNDRFFFEREGGEAYLYITSDGDWSIEKDGEEPWISFSPSRGNKDGTVTITVETNTEPEARSAVLNVYSAHQKTRKKIYIVQKAYIDDYLFIDKVWFLRFYERWDLDYANQIIDYSYRSLTYYPDSESWFFYFTDSLGYLIHTIDGDTLYSPFQYDYFTESDSLYLNFLTVDESVEEYFARVHELSRERFTFSNEYRHHQFEKLYNINVSPNRGGIKVHPEKIVRKSPGPLIPIK